jgi:hypothetical protein
MNIFILCTGRCGSSTFIKACQHITNYTAAHESRAGMLGNDRVNYPTNHIEADNRLVWFLGRLDAAYGDNAIYVHLSRNQHDTAKSFTRRYDSGIIAAYKSEILMGAEHSHTPMQVATDYCNSVKENIQLFLKDKTRTMKIDLASAQPCFTKFWEMIGAEGNLENALKEWNTCYNASRQNKRPPNLSAGILFLKASRIIKKTPRFIKNA